MVADKTGLPSHETLRTEREQVKAEVAQTRTLIARSRAATSAAEQRFADSFDRLAESQKLIRRGDLIRFYATFRNEPLCGTATRPARGMR
jgi:hypothetical protein